MCGVRGPLLDSASSSRSCTSDRCSEQAIHLSVDLGKMLTRTNPPILPLAHSEHLQRTILAPRSSVSHNRPIRADLSSVSHHIPTLGKVTNQCRRIWSCLESDVQLWWIQSKFNSAAEHAFIWFCEQRRQQ